MSQDAFRAALIHHRDGRLEEAAELYRESLVARPDHPDALVNLALLHVSAGRYDEASTLYDRLSALRPDDPELLSNIGNLRFRQGRHADAEEHYRRALAIAPDLAPACANLAEIRTRNGDLAAAAAHYQRALDTDPSFAQARFRLGTILRRSGRPAAAEVCFREFLVQEPGDVAATSELSELLIERGAAADAATLLRNAVAEHPGVTAFHNLLGLALAAAGSAEEAIAAFRAATEADRGDAEAWANLGIVLRRENRGTEARAAFRSALDANPDNAAAHNGEGLALHDQGLAAEALACFERAVALDPSTVEARNNQGLCLQDLGRLTEANTVYSALVEDARGVAEVHLNHGSLLQSQRRFDESVAAFEAAIAIDPEDPKPYPYLAHSLQNVFAWDRLDNVIARVAVDAAAEVLTGGPVSATPFGLQSLPVAMTLKRDVAIATSKQIAAGAGAGGAPQPRHRRPRLRVGYVSPDFRFNSVGLAVRGVVERHDRGRFEVWGYSTYPSGRARDRYADAFRGAFDHYVDAGATSHARLAERIGSDSIDVLIDLSGHIMGHNLSVFASRPAPVQIHWLGFSTTIGADYIPYLISDPVFMPPAMAAMCTEKILYLPETFMATTRWPIPAGSETRADHGLPEDGIVFANLNVHYKLHPEMFELWMRLMRRVPGSVLWLLDGTAGLRANVRRAAEANGVASKRIVFAPRREHDAHLARLALADLVLDHLYHGGGVSTVDALWAGVPVLTIVGETPTQRIGASLLGAANLPELITSTLDDYEDLATALALDAERLAAVRARVAENKDRAPLFDTDRLTRHLETAYEMAWDRWAGGLEPETMQVPALAVTAEPRL